MRIDTSQTIKISHLLSTKRLYLRGNNILLAHISELGLEEVEILNKNGGTFDNTLKHLRVLGNFTYVGDVFTNRGGIEVAGSFQISCNHLNNQGRLLSNSRIVLEVSNLLPGERGYRYIGSELRGILGIELLSSSEICLRRK